MDLEASIQRSRAEQVPLTQEDLPTVTQLASQCTVRDADEFRSQFPKVPGGTTVWDLAH